MLKYLQSRVLLDQINERLVTIATAFVIAKFSQYDQQLGQLIMLEDDQAGGKSYMGWQGYWNWPKLGLST